MLGIIETNDMFIRACVRVCEGNYESDNVAWCWVPKKTTIFLYFSFFFFWFFFSLKLTSVHKFLFLEMVRLRYNYLFLGTIQFIYFFQIYVYMYMRLTNQLKRPDARQQNAITRFFSHVYVYLLLPLLLIFSCFCS